MPDIAIWPVCDHKCTMCSNAMDFKFSVAHYSLEEIKKRIDLYTEDENAITFHRFSDLKNDWTITGGEPTLNPHYFEILSYIREKFPESKIVQLTHGDRFSDEEFTKKISTIDNYHLVFPIHGYNKASHESIVRKSWSWELLIKGIYNVLRYKKTKNQTLELRLIIQWQNYTHLNAMYELIDKYFPEVDTVTSIMMEYEGQAIDNISLTKVDYTKVLEKNESVFLYWGEKWGKEKFRLYHFPLCTIQNPKLWQYTWRTLPPDEITFLKKCENCAAKKYCMGIHENYCEYNGENEIQPYSPDDFKALSIQEDEMNFRFHPIASASKIENPLWKKKTVIFTGYACDNLCRFCIDINKRSINRDTKEILRDILIAKKNGSAILEIIGWEATIRKDFFVIMKFIKSLQFENVYMVTNGGRLSDINFARNLYELNVLNNIVFSIHGHTRELHDSLTQTPGSFEKILQAIKNWQELWFPKEKIGTNTAIEAGNYEYLVEIGKLIKNIWCFGSSEFIFADPNEWWVRNRFLELMPRISQAAPYMRSLLDWGNSNSMKYRVRYVPLCYFEEYLEDNISELKEVQIYSNVTHSAPDFQNNDVIVGRQNAGRIKVEKCKTCKLFQQCEGIWRNYYDQLGWDELRPV